MSGSRLLMQFVVGWVFMYSTFRICSASRADFINLDFESAMVPDVMPGYVPFSNAFPGWTGFYGTNPANQVLYNTVTLGLYNISILRTGNGIVEPIEGQFMAYLQSGYQPPGPYLQVTLAQSGTIPTGTRSIEMKVQTYIDEMNLATELGVTFGGQTIDMHSVQTFPGYRLVRGDVSSLAGLTSELRISTRPSRPIVPNPQIALDSILFSTIPVPEPSCLSLLVAGLIFATKYIRWRAAPGSDLGFGIQRCKELY